jgi:alkaline phosphatase D
MNRRTLLKALSISGLSPSIVLNAGAHYAENPTASEITEQSYQSSWKDLPNMTWTGEELWAQRLQDWEIYDGELVCSFPGPNRTVNLLSHQLSARRLSFQSTVHIRFGKGMTATKGNFAGLKLGVQGTFGDYRSAIFTGTGLNAGINTDGSIFVGDTVSNQRISQEDLQRGVTLKISAEPSTHDYSVSIQIISLAGSTLVALTAPGTADQQLIGNIALVSHLEGKESGSQVWNLAFSDWKVTGKKIDFHAEQIYGPVYFAQYTINRNVLKLSAQLAPVNLSDSDRAVLEIYKDNSWIKVAETQVSSNSRVAAFRLEKWDSRLQAPYRVSYALKQKGKPTPYYYSGTIAAEPTSKGKVKALVMSCNGDFGFPDSDISNNALKHHADMVLFLGDQFYERNGGFGVQTSPAEKAALDVLRKWIQFGWSYRDLFRHVPSICLPDDHDVYHGNLWGASGKQAVASEEKNERQDSGGYIMPPEWVNLIQHCQTSHMPDPYDHTPVAQGISVYYTHWQYAGISFAIIEDRKFKSAPKTVLPTDANVYNGYAMNKEFNIQDYKATDAISLLGDRQMQFLESWSGDWSKGTAFKVLASATPFMCLQTLPKGSRNDQVTGKLEIPEPGAYVLGDAATRDMDTNGWPHNRRDEAVKQLRKAFTFHLAGDQHLPAFVHYGVEDYGDSGYVFTTPALGNVFPRRWWPEIKSGHRHLEGQPAYTGDFEDGFGNKMTVYAAANPQVTGLKPSVVYDRVTGYGVTTFDKSSRDITIECWPRYIDPEKQPTGQFKGWPMKVNQQDNFAKKGIGFLPELQVSGIIDPVIEVIHQGRNERVYKIRIKGSNFRPKIFEPGPYTVIVSNPDLDKQKVLRELDHFSTKPILIKI